METCHCPLFPDDFCASWLVSQHLFILIAFQLIPFTPRREIQDWLYYSPAETLQCLYSAFRVNNRISIILAGSCMAWPLAKSPVCPRSSSSWSLGSSYISFSLVSQALCGTLSLYLLTFDTNIICPLDLKSVFTPPGTFALKNQPWSCFSLSLYHTSSKQLALSLHITEIQRFKL